MKYFETLPLITQTDFNNNAILVNNVLARSYLLPSLQKNVMLFYDYDTREGDTPENLAYRYYNDVNRFWIILLANNIIDPQADWVLDGNQFQLYLSDKYGSTAANANSTILSYTTSTVHHYEEIITTTDSQNLKEQRITIIIDEDSYNNIIPNTTVKSLPGGVQVKKTIDKKAVSIYEYEDATNEEKRKIQIIRDVYATDMERQLQTLMRT